MTEGARSAEARATDRMLRSDTDITDLHIAIDEGSFADVLRKLLPGAGSEVLSARRRYSRYKRATSCLSLFDVEFAGGDSATFLAKAFATAASDKADRIRVDGRDVFMAGERSVVARFPSDAKLPELPKLLNPETRPALLRTLDSDAVEFADSELSPLAYKPERRFVAKLERKDGRLASLKMHASKRHREASRKLISLVSRGSLELPMRLASSHGSGLVLTSWIEGELVADILSRPWIEPNDVARIGASLVELQRQDPKHLSVVRPRVRAAALLAMVEYLDMLDASVGARAARLAERLAARVEAEPAGTTPIHGDFYSKQVLLRDDSVGFIDLDSAARGSDTNDLGCFMAHLDRDVVRQRIGAERAESAATWIVEGYQTECRRSVDAGLEHTVALFGLLADPFRSNEPDWFERTNELIERVVQLESLLPLVRGRALRVAARDLTPGRGSAITRVGRSAPRDPKLPTLDAALDPDTVAAAFESTAFPSCRVEIASAELIRHKPGRRALVDYRIRLHHPGNMGRTTLRALGKLRHRRTDFAAHRLALELERAGFDHRHGVRVPHPLGIVPDLSMWLQGFEPGVQSETALLGDDGVAVAGDIASALSRLHAADLPCTRRHDLGDEVEILSGQLAAVARQLPALGRRVQAVSSACSRLATGIACCDPTGIHRDFHPGQVLVRDDGNLVLLDFDLFALGDPLLDAANFSAHIRELALRLRGDVNALTSVSDMFEATFLRQSSGGTDTDLARHRTLAFARHIAISRRLPERRHATEAILVATEEELAAHGVL